MKEVPDIQRVVDIVPLQAWKKSPIKKLYSVATDHGSGTRKNAV